MEESPEQRLRKLKLEKLRRLQQNKYKYYRPIGKVEEFLDKLGSLKYKSGAFLAANGVGKTTVIANIVANICFPSNNEFFQQPLFKDYPYLKKLRIASDPTTVKEAIIPALKEWLPAGRYKTFNMGKSYEYRWETDTGFQFDIMTYEQSAKEFESANLGLILLDEPPANDIYKACIARLRKGGVLAILCTPLTGSAWLYDEFIANPDMDKEYKFAMTAEVEDACIDHGVRGFLAHDEIEKTIAQYDSDDLQARIFGRFQHLIGMVFKQWKREIHVVRPFDINYEDFVCIDSLDTHPRNEDGYLIVATDRYGTKYVIDEYFKHGTDEELAVRIKKKKEYKRIIKSVIEPAAMVEDQHESNETENSLAKRLMKYGLKFVAGSKRRQDAIRRTKEALNYQMNGNHMVKAPELYVFDTCERLIWEIEHWQWDDWRGKQADTKSPREKAQDKDDHLIECLGRILLEEPKFVEYIKDEYVPPQNSLDPYYG